MPSCVGFFATPSTNLPDPSVHGILQARILEWVAIPFFVNLPDPGIEPGSLALQADYCLSHQGILRRRYYYFMGQTPEVERHWSPVPPPASTVGSPATGPQCIQ